jgi:hypothetical protein
VPLNPETLALLVPQMLQNRLLQIAEGTDIVAPNLDRDFVTQLNLPPRKATSTIISRVVLFGSTRWSAWSPKKLDWHVKWEKG